jgi:hypothetical protein
MLHASDPASNATALRPRQPRGAFRPLGPRLGMETARCYYPPGVDDQIHGGLDVVDVQRIAQAYKESIERSLGLVARVERECSVVFRHPELGVFVAIIHPDDPEHFHMVFPAFLDCRKAGPRERLLVLCNTLNATVKGVKFAMNESSEGEVSASAEAAVPLVNGVPHPDLLDGVVRRALMQIGAGLRMVALRLKGDPAATSQEQRRSPTAVG